MHLNVKIEININLNIHLTIYNYSKLILSKTVIIESKTNKQVIYMVLQIKSFDYVDAKKNSVAERIKWEHEIIQWISKN